MGGGRPAPPCALLQVRAPSFVWARTDAGETVAENKKTAASLAGGLCPSADSYSDLNGWTVRFISPQLDWDVTHLALSNRRGEHGPKLVACANDVQVRMWAGGDASRPQLVEITRQQQADLSRLSMNSPPSGPAGTGSDSPPHGARPPSDADP